LFGAWADKYSETSTILLINGETAYFQRNPILKNRCHTFELNLYQEHSSVMSFGKLKAQDHSAADAMAKIFDEHETDEFDGVVTPNAAFGHQKIIKQFIADVLNTFEAFNCYSDGCDWAAVNYLWYKQRLSNGSSISYKIRSRPEGFGQVHPVFELKQMQERHLYDAKNKIFKNRDKTVSPVILHYHDPKEYFDAKAKSLLAEENA